MHKPRTSRRELLRAVGAGAAALAGGRQARSTEERAAAPAGHNVIARAGLPNARVRFLREREGHVAFLGGSITEMKGYRPMVCEVLRRTFPQTKFTFTDAGIASTCSTTGAFRLRRDVLGAGPVDLLLVEFAVNDTQDAGHPRRECIRGMEGIVRHTRTHNPCADVIITYFVNPEMLAEHQAGKTPLAVAAHEEVARRYAVPSIHLAREVAERVRAGRLTWKQFGGTHPAPLGNRICTGMIETLMNAAWSQPLAKDARRKPHAMPEPVDPHSYAGGRLVDVKQARLDKAWQVHVPPWKTLTGQCRTRFRQAVMLTTEKPNAALTLDFRGTAVGAYVLAGPDAGIVEARVDEAPARKVDLYHRFSRGLHYPRTCMFAAGLKAGPHRLALRMAADHHRDSRGTAMRILHFAVNTPNRPPPTPRL